MSVIKAEWVARDRAVARLPNGGSVVYDYRGTADAPQARAAGRGPGLESLVAPKKGWRK